MGERPKWNSWRRVREEKCDLIVMRTTSILQPECLNNWVKNDLIRNLYVAEDDEINGYSGSDGYVYNYA